MKQKYHVSKLIISFQLSAILIFIYLVSNVMSLIKQQSIEQDSRYSMMLKADKLRQSSDDLTHFARTYVVTKNPQYK